MQEIIQQISVRALPIIVAVVLHEVAHGYMAWLRGDDTARNMGRLTLNPIAHIDWFGTIALPILLYNFTGFLFAYAKPVPVNFMALKDPKRDMVYVAAAGPATNMLIAIISAALIKSLAWLSPEAAMEAYANLNGRSTGVSQSFFIPVFFMLYFSVVINVILGLINMIPVLPADGGRIVAGLLPDSVSEPYSKMEPVGMILLLFILLYNPGNILSWTIYPLFGIILKLLL